MDREMDRVNDQMGTLSCSEVVISHLIFQKILSFEKKVYQLTSNLFCVFYYFFLHVVKH